MRPPPSWNAALYPERAFADFRDAVAGWLGVPPACVIPAHGAQALIGDDRARSSSSPARRVVIPQLTYGLYAQVSAAAGGASPGSTAGDGLAIDLEAVAEAAGRAARGWSGCAIPTTPPAR